MNTAVSKYFPNYLVVHDLSKDELYRLLETTKGVFIITNEISLENNFDTAV